MKRYLTIILILLPLLLIYLHQIVPSYRYDSDFGRDIVDILHITQGDITLIGPKLSFGGIHTGPYYYYLFTPILFLSGLRPESMLIFNAILFWIVLVGLAIWLYWKKIFSLSYSLLSTYFIGFTSYLIFSARGPGNAFSYIPLTLITLIMFPYLLKQNKLYLFLLWGLFSGIIINTHLITIVIYASLFFTWTILSIIQKQYRQLSQHRHCCHLLFV